MKKSYKIEVDCANCANLIEQAIGKLEGINSASISFMTQKMKLDIDDNADEKKVLEAVLKTGRKIEPEFDIL